jgi:hemolysin III
MPAGQLWLLLGGGAAYTLGAVFYAIKKPNPVPGVFGFHEIFHLLVIAGAVLHYLMIYFAITG